MRKFLLVSLLMFGAHVSVALSPGLELGGVAYASDFSGKIKTIRIRERRSGSGYKVRVSAEASNGDVPTAASLSVTDPRTGEALFEATASTARVARGHYAAALDEETLASLERGRGLALSATTLRGRTISLSTLSSAESGGTLQSDAGWVEAVNDDGDKLRARVEDGTLQVVLFDNSGDGAYTVQDGIALTWLNTDQEAVGEASLRGPDRVVQSYVFAIDADELAAAAGGQVQLSSSVAISDGDNAEVSEDGTVRFGEALGSVSASETTDIPGDDSAPTDFIERVSLKETRSGDTKLVIFTSSTDGDLPGLEVQLVDDDSGDYVIDAFEESPVRRTRVFAEPGIGFRADISRASGASYPMSADFYSADGRQVGEQQEIEVTLGAFSADTVSPGDVLAAFTFGGGLGEGAWVYEEGGTVGIVVEWSGDDAGQVSAVDLSFGEGSDGPSPSETTHTADLAYELDKWVVKAPGTFGEGATAALSVTMVDSEGNVQDTLAIKGDPDNFGTGRENSGFLEKDYTDVLQEQVTDDEIDEDDEDE